MGNKEQLERILYNVYTTGYYNALYKRGIDNINWDKVFKELEEALNTDSSNFAPSYSMEKKEIRKIIHEALPSKIIETLYSIGWNELGLYKAIQEALRQENASNSAPSDE